MERPVTPRNDERAMTAHRSSRAFNMSLTRLPDLDQSTGSVFDLSVEAFSMVNHPQQLLEAVCTFESAAESIANIGVLSISDLSSYKVIQPALYKILDDPKSPCLIHLANGLRLLTGCSIATVQVAPVIATPQIGQKPKSPHLAPLKSARSKDAEPENMSIEHFHQFLSKVLFKLSTDSTNDQILCDPGIAGLLINAAQPTHSLETQLYSVAALKNLAHSAQYRSILENLPSLPSILILFNSESRKAVQLFTQLTSLIRNLIQDSVLLEKLVANGVHKVMMSKAKLYPDEGELILNIFRSLTKLSGMESVRSDILDSFGSDSLPDLFIDILSKHKASSVTVSRVAYVFADFAAYEERFLALCRQADLFMLADLVVDENIRSNAESQAMMLQIIANLSVDKDCSNLISSCDSLLKLFSGRTFTTDDRVGLNLLCAASNFTFHNSRWSPAELITSIPVAIISKNLYAIIESLRVLCNLALSPNTLLIDSQIPELLCLLLRHVDYDIVTYALQTLTNLVNHAGIRRRFRAGGGVEAIIDIFKGEKIDELVFEAAAKLAMNFGIFSKAEAGELLSLIDEFEVDPNFEIVTIFKSFLSKVE